MKIIIEMADRKLLNIDAIRVDTWMDNNIFRIITDEEQLAAAHLENMPNGSFVDGLYIFVPKIYVIAIVN